MQKFFKAVFLVLLATSAASQTTGYILTDPSSTSLSSKFTPDQDTSLYQDSDFSSLILHNFGLLDPQPSSESYSDTLKSIINKYGNQNLVSSSKINYLFILESDASDLDQIFLNSIGATYNHKRVSASICEDESCLLDSIYNSANEGSFFNSQKEYLLRQPKNLNLYATGLSAGLEFKDTKLVLTTGQNGNVAIYDGTSKQEYLLSENLVQCVNEAIGEGFVIDFEAQSIIPRDSGAKGLVFSEAQEGLFEDLMNDVCAMHAISSLVTSDQEEPTILTFYIKSVGEAEDTAEGEEKEYLYQILGAAYNKFLKNLENKFRKQEVTGQVLLTSKTGHLAERFDGVQKLIYGQALNLVQTGSTTGTGQEEGAGEQEDSEALTLALNSGQHVQSLFMIPAIIILALILIYLFNMEVYRDTLVYAKFLALDSHK